jgi:DNA-binding transcriptional MocR family regulator
MVVRHRLVSASEIRALLPDLGVRGFRELARAVAQLIDQSRLPLGARMPAERELAIALTISRTTVSASYDLLREHGYLRSRQGAGSWITVPIAGGGRRRLPQLNDALADADEIDLTIAAHAAPAEAVLAATALAVEAMPRYLDGSGYATFGLDVLREAIAADHARRGLATSPEQILVTSGAQHGIDLVLRTLTSPGDRVVVDNPTYPGVLDAITGARDRVVPVDLTVTDEGHEWDLDGYLATVRQTAPALTYLVADFQNPTGATLDADGRARVVAACRRAGTPLLVDEALAELSIDGRDAEPPVATFDPTGGVISVGSLSKSIWGGLRIGWVRADPQLIHRLAVTRARNDMAGPVLEQLIAVELLRDHDALAAERRKTLRRQRDVLVAALKEAIPQWRIRTPPGGLFLWIELDEPSSSQLAAQARGFGLRLAPGSRFGTDVRLERWLRVPFTQSEQSLLDAVARLTTLRHQLGSSIVAIPQGLELIA